MVYTYMAIFRKEDGNSDKYYAWIPDITGCIATDTVFDDAVLQITDALMWFMLVYEDDNMPIPTPTPYSCIEVEDEDWLVSSVTVDTDAYRSMLSKLDFAAIKDWRDDIVALAIAPDSEFITED